MRILAVNVAFYQHYFLPIKRLEKNRGVDRVEDMNVMDISTYLK